ncbi:hypothetical protein B0H13DRAFT_2513601 [Mycena leptocephala]|nr:hypothetical protein B0H13DRAFT_2513601 [Mycena leptocephala]
MFRENVPCVICKTSESLRHGLAARRRPRRHLRRVASVPNAKALCTGSRPRSNSTTKNGRLAPSEPVPPVPPLPSVIVSDATDITIAVPHLKSRAAPPFRADGANILLGSIGGLGINLAVWMHEVRF